MDLTESSRGRLMDDLGHSAGSREPLLLMHGIWMTGLEMSLMGQRLSRQGYAVRYFRYNSLGVTPEQNAHRLNRFIQRWGTDRLHMVAHSLGGLVLLHLFHLYPSQPQGRLVLLGSSVNGSQVARRVAAKPFLRLLAGRSMKDGLDGGAPAWQGDRELGTITGTRSNGLGVGKLFGGVSGESDGTVAVAETRLDGATDAITLHLGHFELLVSKKAVDQVVAFLQNGHFRHTPGADGFSASEH